MFREKWIIIISLVIGLAAAGFFYLYSGNSHFLRSRKTVDAAPVAKITKPCVIVMKDVPRRTALSKDMLSVVNVPAELAHPQAVPDMKSAVGRITNDRLIKGQFLLEPNIRDKDTISELGFVLPKNMRAITIGATITSAVGNMLQPGDYVDVLVYLNSQIAGENVTFALLKKVLILATDTQIENEKEKSGITKVTGSVENAKGYQSVTLAVSAADCVKLNLAESVGQIKLVLHSSMEQKLATFAGKEIAVTGDLAKEFGFKVAKSNMGAAAPAPAQTAAMPVSKPQTASAKTDRDKSASVASKPHAPERFVYIMHGTKLETMTAAAVEPNIYAKEKGEAHEN